MKKSIQKPENWQDFESLCKKLWGEIWECPNIKKNGRPGQQQHGVDISGIPKNKVRYHGIQCKGKHEYYSANITKIEIDKEIANAELFKPELECLIIATSANKDAIIETYVRELNVQRIQNNKFSIELFCWEEIADLLDENQETFNWYIGNNQFKDKFDVEILLLTEGGKNTLFPSFSQTEITLDSHHIPKIRKKSYSELIIEGHPLSSFERRINKSLAPIGFEIFNNGSKVLEDFKLIIEIEQEFSSIEESNEEGEYTFAQYTNGEIYIEDNIITFSRTTPLVQKDKCRFTFYIKPNPRIYNLNISWKFLSRNYSKEGNTEVSVEPKFIINSVVRKPNTNEKDGEKIIRITDLKEKI
ncbi:hypothetical protein ND856_19145 [Leptospira bandrabouensis]|uniref:restriction endonuclease n=1 Tax=Leptospira bandrabouensis TaxID=2484903 RepID=UPI00223CC4C6|nr:hypothetical protein [Leptospira bandrabouensis]MCW7479425.1 hypothetical protein [Leptospira bandrabouensis]MCW7487110.1 hypothetical protein [Leptospira bandrabouensis]